MMTSNSNNMLYVWIFLPGLVEPVVAGRLYESDRQGVYHFNYGRTYLERDDAVPVYEAELPLKRGEIQTADGLEFPSAIRDGSPDAWGRRVIIHSMYGVLGKDIEGYNPGELEFMLRSGSDRIGAIDFQISATEYVPRLSRQATLDELLQSAELIDKSIPLSEDLMAAIQYGTPVGGARPKALITDGERKYIAKFSTSNDTFSVVKGEYIAMRLASEAGMNVSNVALKQASGKDILLVERFDRTYQESNFLRKRFISGLTLFGVSEMQAAYVSYEELAEIVRMRFKDPTAQLIELFQRMTFNILCGNTDDHARNHGALIEEHNNLTLSPAYDICPQNRVGREASQGMRLFRVGYDNKFQNLSFLGNCLELAPAFNLSRSSAREMILNQITTIGRLWGNVCDEANFSDIDKAFFVGNQFLNPFSYEGLNREDGIIIEAAQDSLSMMQSPANRSRPSFSNLQ